MSEDKKENLFKIEKSSNYSQHYAEIAGCTVYTIGNNRMANIAFISHETVPFTDLSGNIVSQNYEKKIVSNITMTYEQLEKFYLSLKRQIAENNNE
ncbi:hypothetical protein [Brenneria goodwinii]|uniref:hypothetical protein n=1 Tax=Brenneria goodwinii TaxID=1109412 RepID=UPI0036E84F59